MRISKIGEIHYIMKESMDPINVEKKDQYAWIIHNYEMILWLDDKNNKKGDLEENP